ncbi:efflux RND transporter permease subunit, partial [Acinetobacter baumannii]
IFTPINQYRVVMEVAPQYWQSPDGLNDIRVRTASGTTVPLAAFTKVVQTPAALSVNHQSQFAATTFSFNLAPGYVLSDAVRAIDE